MGQPVSCHAAGLQAAGRHVATLAAMAPRLDAMAAAAAGNELSSGSTDKNRENGAAADGEQLDPWTRAVRAQAACCAMALQQELSTGLLGQHRRAINGLLAAAQQQRAATTLQQQNAEGACIHASCQCVMKLTHSTSASAHTQLLLLLVPYACLHMLLPAAATAPVTAAAEQAARRL